LKKNKLVEIDLSIIGGGRLQVPMYTCLGTWECSTDGVDFRIGVVLPDANLQDELGSVKRDILHSQVNTILLTTMGEIIVTCPSIRPSTSSKRKKKIHPLKDMGYSPMVTPVRDFFHSLYDKELPKEIVENLNGYDILYGAGEGSEINFAKATEFLSMNEPEAAIIFAQTACELKTMEVLSSVLKSKERDFYLIDLILPTLKPIDICSEKVRDFYEALTEDEIGTTFNKWSQLKAHNKCRHEAVHGGKRFTLDEARRSLDVVKSYMEHVEKVWVTYYKKQNPN